MFASVGHCPCWGSSNREHTHQNDLLTISHGGVELVNRWIKISPCLVNSMVNIEANINNYTNLVRPNWKG